MEEVLSYSEFARQRGVSQPMVSKYIKKGIITKASLKKCGKGWKIIPSLAVRDIEIHKKRKNQKIATERERNQRAIVDGVDFSDVVFDLTSENVGFMFLLSLRIQLFIAACLLEPYKKRLSDAIGNISKVFDSDMGDLIGEEIKQKIKEVPGYPKPTGGLQDYINLDDSEYTKDDENIFKNLPDFDDLFKDAPDFDELLKDTPDFAP